MAIDELLREFETLPYGARMRRMVELGREAREDSGVAATVDALAAGNAYHRALALQSCYGSCDGGRVLAALVDPSRGLRAQALALVPLLCDDTQALEAFGRLQPRQQRRLAKRLRRRGRQGVVDAFLELLVARGEEHFTALLRFGSGTTVEANVEAALERMTDGEVRGCARLHPAITAAALARRAEAVEQLDRRLLWLVNAALPELAEWEPDAALSLLHVLLPSVGLARLNVQTLAERRPAEVADLVLQHPGEAPVRFEQVAHRLDLERLLALIERRPRTLREHYPWFRRLRPEQRAAVYSAFGRGWRDSRDCLSTQIIASLPRPVREAEARRHVALPALAARPAERIAYAQFLSWDEARNTLDAPLRDPDAELRGLALATLISAVRYQRARLGDALALILARPKEQDPVRNAMLAALAALPPSAFKPEHLGGVGQVLRQALDAADLSEATAMAGQNLIVALLPFHPAWAAEWLHVLVRERGRVAYGTLESRLSDDDVRHIAPVLLPVLRSWEEREREAQVLDVARQLGRRLEVFDELVEMVERITERTRNQWVAREGLTLLARYRRERLHALVPALLGATSGRMGRLSSRLAGHGGDPSWITQSVVHTYLHRHRQDLLTPFLGQRAYRGRFSTGKTRFVLPLLDGFYRWTDTQQGVFARTLAELVGDDERDTPAVFRSITQLAALPAVAPAQLIALANDRRPVVRDLALRALGRLDGDEGVPTLLQALQDERASIAIYTLRRAILEMPASRAVALLRETPVARVTVAKEVVRLLGEIRAPEALQELLALDRSELHRDVRVALLRALWGHLANDEVWPILLRAATSPDAVFARSVGRIPADRLSPVLQRRLAGLLATLLGHPDTVVRVEVLQRCAQQPLSDSERVLLSPILRALGSASRDEYSAAASALFQIYTGRDAALVGPAVEQIRANRRALSTTVAALRSAVRTSPEQQLATVRVVLGVLGPDPLTAQLQVELAVEGLPLDEQAAALQRLAAAGMLHTDVLCSAIRVLEQGGSRHTAAELTRLEETLAGSAEPALRRLALAALIAGAGGPGGWSDDRLRRLETFRHDAAPSVAAAAQFTFPASEE